MDGWMDRYKYLSSGNIGIKVSGIITQLSVLKMDDIGTHSVQEILGMRDNYQYSVICFEIFFQPHASL